MEKSPSQVTGTVHWLLLQRSKYGSNLLYPTLTAYLHMFDRSQN